MIDPKILPLIRCPLDGQPLEIASSDLIAQLNEQIKAGELRDRADGKVSETVDEGLITADGQRFYPARKGIPTLIVDQAIDLAEPR